MYNYYDDTYEELRRVLAAVARKRELKYLRERLGDDRISNFAAVD